jgi:hypothetical protein
LSVASSFGPSLWGKVRFVPAGATSISETDDPLRWHASSGSPLSDVFVELS